MKIEKIQKTEEDEEREKRDEIKKQIYERKMKVSEIEETMTEEEKSYLYQKAQDFIKSLVRKTELSETEKIMVRNKYENCLLASTSER